MFGRQLELIKDDIRYNPLQATRLLSELSKALESKIPQIAVRKVVVRLSVEISLTVTLYLQL